MSVLSIRGVWFAAKFIAASFVIGLVLSWFNLTPETLTGIVGVSPIEVLLLIWDGFTWTLPHVLLGATVIAPIWALFYLLRPPLA